MRSVGTLFFVVGPSGVGKDSLIDGLRSRLDENEFVVARRVITRPADAGGEAHEACTEEQFVRREAAGEFLVSWQAHGLRYGIPGHVVQALAAGRHVIANGSRGAAALLAERVANLVVVEIDAPAEIIAARLDARGRESAEEIARRLSRPAAGYPESLKRVRVINDRDLHTGVLRLEGAVRAQFDPPDDQAGPRDMLLHKLGGKRLGAAQWAKLLGSVLAGEICGEDLRSLLITCATELDDDELVSVARWRASLMPRINWGQTPVVDKHSLGGTAGSRVTMVVIPIVAAHGMVIPKTSSRAITSAAGTADAMEVLAKVDLTPEELKETVRRAGACIAWNGRLNHSVLDEAMHGIERELGLDTRRWSVASILSKKWSAGSTHVVIDIPYMPAGKVASLEDASALAQLFEAIGARLGLVVRAFPSDGSAPIGRGIGPALEVRDVLRVLDGQPNAPADLREKSLFFAGQILAFDPEVGTAARGLERARQILASGLARRTLETIIDGQGRRPRPDEKAIQTAPVLANTAGWVAQIDSRRISAIARIAGAPADPLAGVDLCCQLGNPVTPGELLYRVQSCDRERLAQAIEASRRVSGVRITSQP